MSPGIGRHACVCWQLIKNKNGKTNDGRFFLSECRVSHEFLRDGRYRYDIPYRYGFNAFYRAVWILAIFETRKFRIIFFFETQKIFDFFLLNTPVWGGWGGRDRGSKTAGVESVRVRNASYSPSSRYDGVRAKAATVCARGATLRTSEKRGRHDQHLLASAVRWRARKFPRRPRRRRRTAALVNFFFFIFFLVAIGVDPRSPGLEGLNLTRQSIRLNIKLFCSVSHFQIPKRAFFEISINPVLRINQKHRIL